MGFETNAAALLLKMRRDGVDLGRMLTLGHQHLHLVGLSHSQAEAGLAEDCARPPGIVVCQLPLCDFFEIVHAWRSLSGGMPAFVRACF